MLDLKQKVDKLELEVTSLRKERDELKEKLNKKSFTIGQFTDQNVKRYTGVPNIHLFAWIVSLVSEFITDRHVISIPDQVLLVLMKLRLGITNWDLAYRFDISRTTVSEIINECIPIFAQRFKFLIRWPSKEVLLKNMPRCFKRKFGKCCVIIDCTEFFMERPFNLKTRAKTWSNCKHHHTLKCLIGITPHGAVSFLSRCWGGRISDKDLTKRSGFYDMLNYGDQVMADRGFTISQELAQKGAYLVMPPFVKGRRQLPGRTVEKSRQISALRIHVERAIERIKNYVILKNTLPLTLVPLASDIVVICGALTNLSPKLIS